MTCLRISRISSFSFLTGGLVDTQKRKSAPGGSGTCNGRLSPLSGDQCRAHSCSRWECRLPTNQCRVRTLLDMEPGRRGPVVEVFCEDSEADCCRGRGGGGGSTKSSLNSLGGLWRSTFRELSSAVVVSFAFSSEASVIGAPRCANTKGLFRVLAARFHLTEEGLVKHVHVLREP